QQGLVHPWMIFNNNDIPAIKAKLALPANAQLYKSLGYGTGLKYALYGDTDDITVVRKNCFDLVLSARKRMVAGDAWGGFQWGRRMQELLIPISLVINNTVKPFTPAEIARLRLSCDSIAWRLRDATYSEVGPGGGPNNRTLDEIMGVAFAGVFMFPDNPNTANHYAYVQKELTRHLAYVGSDGLWPEVPRYVGQVVIKCMLLFARVQKNYLGNETGLISDPRYKSIIRGFMQCACPKDVLNKNYRDAPAIGDVAWGEGNLAFLAWAAAELSTSDPVLAKQLMGVWKMAGGTYNMGGTFSYQLALADAQAPADTTYILPSVIQNKIGYYIFRNYYNTPNESYLITHLPVSNTYHRHADSGAFSFFAKSTPLLLDAGVGDYAEPEVSFYKSTVNHNVVCFKDVNGNYVNGNETSSKIVDTFLSTDYDFFSANITPPNNVANAYIRSLGYLKTLFNSIVIYDYVDTNTGTQHSNNLHTFTTSTDQQVVNGFNQTISHGYNGVDIEMNHLLPLTNITYSKLIFSLANSPAAWPRNLANRKDVADMGNCYQQSISVNNSGKSHYLTVIRPKETTEAQSTIASLTLSNTNCKGFQVTVPEKGSYVIIINTSTAVQNTSVQMATNTSLVSQRTKTKYTMDSTGKFSVGIPAMSMDVFVLDGGLSDVNPVVSPFNIEIYSSGNKGVYEIAGDCEGANYSVINLMGKTVQCAKKVQAHQSIDISDHPQGTYLVRIEKDGRTGVKKIIKT
ncbi:MAG: heparinase II/III domain-containing protein, partial [Bacteroidales bacterium]